VQTILSHAKISDIHESPFVHLHIENALEEDYYKSLSETFPDASTFNSLYEQDSATKQNNFNLIFSAVGAARSGLVNKTWQEFIEAHSSAEFFNQTISLIGDFVRKRYPDLETRLGKPLEELTVGWRSDDNDAEVQIDCQFAMNTPVTVPSSVRGVHVDNTRKLFNALLYMRLENDETAGGDLGIFKFKDQPTFEGVQVPDEAVEQVDVIPYQSNSVILFMNSPESLHGVTVRNVTPHPRRYVNFLAEFREPLFDLKPYQSSSHFNINIPKSPPAEQPVADPKPTSRRENDMSPLRIVIGYDDRQIPASSALIQSIINTSSKPVAITPLVISALPTDRAGLTPFTYSRFLTPWLCNFEGWALFMDNDMLVLGDLAELFDYADDQYAIMVNKSIEPFEWASVMLFNCSHPANKVMTPEFLSDPDKSGVPHSFEWLGDQKDTLIGAFPTEWNHTIGYDQPRSDAKIAHYTMGIPAHPEIDGCEYSEEWHKVFDQTLSLLDWHGMMGQSVHAAHLPDGRVLPKLHPDAQKLVQK
jgi:hypothetical protein